MNIGLLEKGAQILQLLIGGPFDAVPQAVRCGSDTVVSALNPQQASPKYQHRNELSIVERRCFRNQVHTLEETLSAILTHLIHRIEQRIGFWFSLKIQESVARHFLSEL